MTLPVYFSALHAIRGAAHALGFHYWANVYPDVQEETQDRAGDVWRAALSRCGVMEERVLYLLVQANNPQAQSAVTSALASVIERHVHVEPGEPLRRQSLRVAEVCLKGFFGQGLSTHTIWRQQGGGLPHAFAVRNVALSWLMSARDRALGCAEEGLRAKGYLDAVARS